MHDGGMCGRGWHVWWQGVCMVSGGHVWQGGMHGGGHAWWQGVVCGGGEACVGYDEIRSMSGRYASYWNPFLLIKTRSAKCNGDVRM